MQLGLENKTQTTWAIVLGVIAVLALAYVLVTTFTGSTAATSSSVAASGAPAPGRGTGHGAKGKKARAENLDPTLRLDLLASVEQTQYEGSGRNIFTSEAEIPTIPTPGGPGHTDVATAPPVYTTPAPPTAPPIPLKFYGFASRTGEPKRVFLIQGEEVFVAGEGEIVNRRYKVVRISPTSVEMQDMVYSGPSQHIPLTQG